MKNKLRLQNLIFQVGFIAVFLFGITSCNQGDKDATEVAEEQNDEKFDDRSKERDAEFLVDVADINLEEIELGKLAQKNYRTPCVKELGKMMQDDHQKSYDELKALADKLGVTVPTTPGNKAMDNYNDMKGKTGTDFDKKYTDMMVDSHKDAIRKFEKIIEKTENQELRDWANKSLSGLRAHLDHSMSCEEKAKNNNVDEKGNKNTNKY